MAVSYNRQYEGRASCVPAVRFCDSYPASYADEPRRTQGQTAKICPTSCLTPRSGDGTRPCRGSTTRVSLLAKFADGDARIRRPYAPQGLHRCTPSLVDEDATDAAHRAVVSGSGAGTAIAPIEMLARGGRRRLRIGASSRSVREGATIFGGRENVRATLSKWLSQRRRALASVTRYQFGLALFFVRDTGSLRTDKA